MFRLNLKIALRNLLRHKMATLINISGLAIGLAASMMLLLYVAYQFDYDKQFGNIENTYHVMFNFYGADKNITGTGPQGPNIFAETLREEYPEVEHISRLQWASRRLLANSKDRFKVDGRYADPDLLKIFKFEYLSGNADKALSDPNSIVLTESIAKRLFGSTDVLNKSIRYENQVDLKVSAVIRDLPANFTYGFECLTPWKLNEQLNTWVADPNWLNYSFYNLLTLKKGTDLELFNQKIANFMTRHAPSKTVEGSAFAYPLKKYHLYGHFVNGKPSGGQIEQVRILVVLALGILLIACINFMNLATARSQKRAKEIGIRKTVGASRQSLITQFLLESFILTLIAVIAAFILVELFLPKFNTLLNTSLAINYHEPYNWLAVVVLIVLTALLSGSYPAIFLSSFNPVQALKQSVKFKSKLNLNLREVLVVVQFSFAIILIVATLIIYQQLQYLKNKPLGYNTNALVEMPHQGNLYPKFDHLKERLLNSGAVVSMCQSSGSISNQNSNNSGLEWAGMAESDRKTSFDLMYTTYDFLKTNQIKLITGRDFKLGHGSDATGILLNQTAVKRMNFKEPIGQTVVLNGIKRQVIGVFSDVIWGEPTMRGRPMVVAFNVENSDFITMRLNTNRSIKDNLDRITAITKEINPDFPVDIQFVDNLVAEKVEHEQMLAVLSNLFGGLAIFISCLGLFGLSAFSAEQRTKEIGVRKVLGASVPEIIRLLSVSFIKTVMMAIVIAMPIAYLMMNNWLLQFDYHVSIKWTVFVITALATMTIALLTVSLQAYKAAKTNPVEALKYE